MGDAPAAAEMMKDQDYTDDDGNAIADAGTSMAELISWVNDDDFDWPLKDGTTTKLFLSYKRTTNLDKAEPNDVLGLGPADGSDDMGHYVKIDSINDDGSFTCQNSQSGGHDIITVPDDDYAVETLYKIRV